MTTLKKINQMKEDYNVLTEMELLRIYGGATTSDSGDGSNCCGTTPSSSNCCSSCSCGCNSNSGSGSGSSSGSGSGGGTTGSLKVDIWVIEACLSHTF